MDRRSALQRLAVGGATVVGATAIMSQTAFAYTDPIVTGSPVVSVNTTGTLTAAIVIGSLPLAMCPGSATSTPLASQVSLSWSTFWPGASMVMSTGSGASVSISPAFTRWFFDDRIRMTLVYRYQCVYAGSTAEICVQWFREFTVSGGGGATATWALVGGSSTGPTTVGCPASAAAASRSSSVWYAPGGRTADGIPFS